MREISEELLDRNLQVRVSEGMWQRLEQIARDDMRPVSHVARIALQQYLNRRKA